MEWLNNLKVGPLKLLIGFILVTILLNLQVIFFDMMYMEQALLYVVNQEVHGVSDLLRLYLHPRFLHFTVPFFRPSGHFLVYQLMSPWVGWHNTKAFICINLVFLAVCGWLMTRIYSKLFPGYIWGGFIAFAIYLMHPAMVLARLTIMHFDYAYVCVTLLSLYYFILFCEKHTSGERSDVIYLLSSVLLLFFATTFKESAIMLGPVLVAYFYIVCKKASLQQLQSKESVQVVLLITVITVVSFFYLTMPWKSFFENPFRGAPTLSGLAHAARILFARFFGFGSDSGYSDYIFQHVSNPIMAQVVMVSCGIVSLLGLSFYFRRLSKELQHGFVFLISAGLLFLVLPVLWQVALGMHLSLTLVFFSLTFGFSLEYFLKRYLSSSNNQKWAIALVISIALITCISNYENIQFFKKHYALLLNANKNAVFHPPLPKTKITPDTIVLVEDVLLKEAYYLGNSLFPYMANDLIDGSAKIKTRYVFNTLALPPNTYTVEYVPLYNGTLFKYAYFEPRLREEEYPFDINNMQKVPEHIVYNWLQNKKHILCFGYDAKGQWQDKTALFQKNLLTEQSRRQLHPSTYTKIAKQMWDAKVTLKLLVSAEDPDLCKMRCDKHAGCEGFALLAPSKEEDKSQCLLYSGRVNKTTSCEDCALYIRKG